jgi:hypothetical protein
MFSGNWREHYLGGTVRAYGLEPILKIGTMKNHTWPQTKFVSLVELLWISSRHIVVDSSLECTSKTNFYMILRVTVYDLAASLKLMLSRLLSRKIRSDFDWPVHLLLVWANMFSLLDKNINATLNYVWIEINTEDWAVYICCKKNAGQNCNVKVPINHSWM